MSSIPHCKRILVVVLYTLCHLCHICLFVAYCQETSNIILFCRYMMSVTKENEIEDVEASKSSPVVVGKKPVHPIIWNLMLIIG